jgi:hypothetical protein
MLRKFGLILIAFVWCFSLPLLAAENIPYLLTAAAKGDVKTVQAMLASGVNPNTADSEGITALMYAGRRHQYQGQGRLDRTDVRSQKELRGDRASIAG